MIGVIYTTLLFAVLGFIFVRGGKDERIVASALVLGSITTYFVFISFGRSFTALQAPLLVNEAAVLTVLLTVALWSKRFWPIPVASFQVAAFLSLLTPFFGKNILSHGLGVAQGIWAYPQLAILVLATVRGYRSNRRAQPKIC